MSAVDVRISNALRAADFACKSTMAPGHLCCLDTASRLKKMGSTMCDEVTSKLLATLSGLGVELHRHPSQQDVDHAFAKVWANFDGRPLEMILELPLMTDQKHLHAMEVLADLCSPACCTEHRLSVLVVCQMVNLSLEHGSSPPASQGFALLGWLMGTLTSRYHEGLRLTRLACNLADQSDAPIYQGRTYTAMGLAASWTESLSTSIDWFRVARQKSIDASEHNSACHCSLRAGSLLLMRGHDLSGELQEIRGYVDYARDVGSEDEVASALTVERTVACLKGTTRGLADFSDDSFDGKAFEMDLDRSSTFTTIQWYWTRKTMLHFMAGQHTAALEAARHVDTGEWTDWAQLELLDYRFFSALALCACLRSVASVDKSTLRSRLSEHSVAIQQWEQDTQCSTFSDRNALVQAEVARLDGEVLEAQHLYELSIELARKNGCLQNEALSFELASRFYGERGFDRIARSYLRDAIDCYSRWGALAKVRLLTQSLPELRRQETDAREAGRDSSSDEVVESSRMPKSQLISSELVTENLITTLMRAVVEHAGAERAILTRPHAGNLEFAAAAQTVDDSLVVSLGQDLSSKLEIPESVIRYVLRTGECVVVDDAQSDNRFAKDHHVLESQVRSMLCLPIGSQGEVQALLYLENNLTPGVFTLAHLEVLQLLAAQAIISLENTQLFADLASREYKIRRIIEVDVIGIVFWDLNGQLLDANDAFLRMVGYGRDELENGDLRWYDMTPPEWREQVVREVQELSQRGTLHPIEKEFFRKDGTRVPVLMGAATFEGAENQGVAIVIDLSKQKEAETRATMVESSNRMLHAELTQTNRLMTMGHLSAWIAHDVKQPLAALVTSANAGLRWLDNNPPNTSAAVRALERILRDGKRAANILDRTRGLVKKAAPLVEAVDVNAIVEETLSLVSLEAQRNGIRIRTQLSDLRLTAAADRIQVQQVTHNLMVNAIEAMAMEPVSQARELYVVSQLDLEHGVLVEVRDTGPGLPAASIEQCFEAFYSTKPDGLGMGLAIARSIVESFGGRISSLPNLPRGAILRFSLPAFRE